MTHRIYYADPSCSSFEAVVARVFVLEGRPAVALDRTAFYPTSGGQPFDTGTLAGIRVLDVVDQDDDTIAHVMESTLAEGTRVAGIVDWARRFDHMQQHTGQHVLSAAFDHLFDNRTMSFHMGAELSTIDLAKEMAPDAIAAAEAEANRIVWEDRPVSIRFVTAEEAAKLPLRKEPARGGTLRLIDVADYDLSACGGTHVARTGAIGAIGITGWERFRGGTRVTFACGGRALQAFRSYRDAVTSSIRSLSVLPHELPSAIERLQDEGREMRRSLKSMQEALATHEAARFVAEAPVVNGVRAVVRSVDGWDAAGLKGIAAAATSQDSVAVVLISNSTPALVVVARSKNVGVDAGALLKNLVARFGGRGGGKPELAQGGGLAGNLNEIVAAARSAVEEQIAKTTQGARQPDR
jgi:alanyl-tRNA synthetase